MWNVLNAPINLKNNVNKLEIKFQAFEFNFDLLLPIKKEKQRKNE